MKFEFTEDWCIKMARAETDAEISAGLLAIDPAFDGEVASLPIFGIGHEAVRFATRSESPAAPKSEERSALGDLVSALREPEQEPFVGPELHDKD